MIRYLVKRSALFAIKIYQKTLSFDHGLPKRFFPYGYCRFHPTCSVYAYQSIEKYGVFKGGFLAFKRVLKCNPLSKGGEDPVI
ncbi:MAG: membrane protein insertion efficiency factor YidD [Patescibacteria group bacterium]